jgi:hypothetical protein
MKNEDKSGNIKVTRRRRKREKGNDRRKIGKKGNTKLVRKTGKRKRQSRGTRGMRGRRNEIKDGKTWKIIEERRGGRRKSEEGEIKIRRREKEGKTNREGRRNRKTNKKRLRSVGDE